MENRPVSDPTGESAPVVVTSAVRPHEPGTILRERYRLTEVVGQGGMGSVYRAEDLRLPGRLCAVKEVPLDSQLSPQMRAQAQSQFLQEASILAQLDHPNLPKVSDYFSEDTRDYLVMDFVPGKDLKVLLDESRATGDLLSESVVLRWATQIIDALTYLHQQQPPVVHRDIKPGNIKLTPDNRIKLVDFGLVKLLATDEARTITVVQGRGTALYTPLEQYGGDSGHTDVRTDIYALGATLYHLLTGNPPPDAKARFLNPSALRPPREVNPALSETASEAILWAMEMHPDDRPQSVDQFEQTLFGRRRVLRASAASEPTFLDAVAANRWAFAAAAVLLIIAIILTLR